MTAPCSRLCPFVACATCPWRGGPDPDLLDQLKEET